MLAERIARLLGTPELQMSMKENNLSLAKEFAVDIIAKEYLRIFQQAASGSTSGRGTRYMQKESVQGMLG
jgi:glycosyltransferase involved in cell wall biosynthesis